MATNKQQLSATLEQFYSNPVAKVSLELMMTIGLVLFLAVFAIRPTLLTMSDLVKEIEEKRELDDDLRQKAAALGTAQSEYLAIQPRLFLLDQAIPSDPQIMEVAKIVEKLATEENVLITTLSFPEVPEEDGEVLFSTKSRQSVPVNVAVNGDYLSIKNFVSSLQDSRRVISIDTIVFSLEENRGQSSLRASITLSIPYFGT